MLRPILAGLLTLAIAGLSQAANPLIVHEWGTFTSLQDESGSALGRINTDDEPVPPFVHQIARDILFPPTIAYDSDVKGSPAGDPMVTMRLETPVLYFHAPANGALPSTLDVHVSFNGGWLTQYFPDATAQVQGAIPGQPARLTSATVGTLAWHNIKLNSPEGTIPQTTDHVWLSPRNVAADSVTVAGEREKFLFYRGVGHVDSPVRVLRSDERLEFQDAAEGISINKLWLVDIRADGSVAFRTVGKIEPRIARATAATFTETQYSPDNLAKLQADILTELTAAGLFEDEARGLLKTWERSYFQNPGQRVFFIVPQKWTDAVLPLTISADSKITRVMVGRIELVTPAQRALLKQMAAATTPATFAALRPQLKIATAAMAALSKDPQKTDAYLALAGGHGNLHDLNANLPPAYQDYLALGRFRTALLLDSQEKGLPNLACLLTP